MIFKLPCKPQVFYLLTYLYGEGVKAKDTGDMIQSNLFLNLVARNKLTRLNYLQKNIELGKSTYKCIYSIEVDNRDVFSFGIKEIPNAAVVRINEFCEHMFNQFFHEELMLLKTTTKLKQNKAIEFIMQMLSIDEEMLSFETLKKNYFRYRANRQEFFKKTSQSFVPKKEHSKKTNRIGVNFNEEDFAVIKKLSKQYTMSFSDVVLNLSLSKLPDVQL